MVAGDDVDVVMVHAENARHADPVVAAAEAGKDAFTEKPIATTLAAARRMADAAGVDGTAAFVSRFSKKADRAKAIVDSGVLGDILLTRSLVGIAEIGCPPDMVAWMNDPVLGGGGAWIDEGGSPHAIPSRSPNATADRLGCRWKTQVEPHRTEGAR